MNESDLISHIEDLGLSNKEARVYVASLKVGPSAVQKIADQAGIKRVTTYVVLESLIGLGLIAQNVKGKKTYYSAESPANLKQLIEKREQELRDQQSSFIQILPELEGLKLTPKESPNVKFHEGSQEIRTVIADFMVQVKKSDARYVYGFSNVDELRTHFPDLVQAQVNSARLRAGLSSRFLYTSKEGAVLQAGDDAAKRESRWLPVDKVPTSSDFTIVGDTILMLSFTDAAPLGITITSQTLAAGLRAMFDLAWEAAATYNEN